MYSKDAIYYDDLNSKLQVEDILFYKKVIPKEAENICEIACGTGRILFSLDQEKRKLMGIDLSQEMLEAARKKQGKLLGSVQLKCMDMCSLDFIDSYDVIICGYNSMQHICDDVSLENFFRGVKRNLASDGIFILDVFQPNSQFLFEAGNKRKIADFPVSEQENIKVIEETRYHPDTLINDITYHYYRNGEFLFDEQYHMKQYAAEVLDAVIEKNGFEIRNKYGDYSMNHFSDSSQKQIYILQKKRK